MSESSVKEAIEMLKYKSSKSVHTRKLVSCWYGVILDVNILQGRRNEDRAKNGNADARATPYPFCFLFVTTANFATAKSLFWNECCAKYSAKTFVEYIFLVTSSRD